MCATPSSCSSGCVELHGVAQHETHSAVVGSGGGERSCDGRVGECGVSCTIVRRGSRSALMGNRNAAIRAGAVSYLRIVIIANASRGTTKSYLSYTTAVL